VYVRMTNDFYNNSATTTLASLCVLQKQAQRGNLLEEVSDRGGGRDGKNDRSTRNVGGGFTSTSGTTLLGTLVCHTCFRAHVIFRESSAKDAPTKK